jgi:hypothetical protein
MPLRFSRRQALITGLVAIAGPQFALGPTPTTVRRVATLRAVARVARRFGHRRARIGRRGNSGRQRA